MKIKLRDLFSLNQGINALDVIDQKTGVALYVFKGAMRMSLSRKMRVLGEAVKDYQQARKKLEAEMGIKAETPKEDPAKWKAFDEALGVMHDAEIDVELGTKIKASELDLDRNQIPSAVINFLAPVLDEAL